MKRMSLEGSQYNGFRVKSLEEPKTKRSRGVVVTDRYGRNIAFKSAEEAAAYIGVNREVLNKALRESGSINGKKVRAKIREKKIYIDAYTDEKTQISRAVKLAVWERDGGRCVIWDRRERFRKRTIFRARRAAADRTKYRDIVPPLSFWYDNSEKQATYTRGST